MPNKPKCPICGKFGVIYTFKEDGSRYFVCRQCDRSERLDAPLC